ncbi:MAG TPA: DUF4279 domain-containing protein, partial [Anaerolineales bacterium]
MSNSGDGQQEFRTLRGFLEGEEPNDEDYFAYSASLRIGGQDLDFEDISKHLGVLPTHSHRKGERKGKKSPPFEEDMWNYKVPLDEKIHLAEHINALWTAIKPSKEYLLQLKKTSFIDVFLSYRSNVDTAGIEIP